MEIHQKTDHYCKAISLSAGKVLVGDFGRKKITSGSFQQTREEKKKIVARRISFLDHQLPDLLCSVQNWVHCDPVPIFRRKQ
jgi:hypothetical protein